MEEDVQSRVVDYSIRGTPRQNSHFLYSLLLSNLGSRWRRSNADANGDSLPILLLRSSFLSLIDGLPLSSAPFSPRVANMFSSLFCLCQKTDFLSVRPRPPSLLQHCPFSPLYICFFFSYDLSILKNLHVLHLDSNSASSVSLCMSTQK